MPFAAATIPSTTAVIAAYRQRQLGWPFERLLSLIVRVMVVVTISAAAANELIDHTKGRLLQGDGAPPSGQRQCRG